jgi:predicted nucleic acid-binding protein
MPRQPLNAEEMNAIRLAIGEVISDLEKLKSNSEFNDAQRLEMADLFFRVASILRDFSNSKGV